MADNENCQPRSGVVGAKMTIRFVARGAAVDNFEIVMEQSTSATARAPSQSTSNKRIQ